MIKCEDGVTEMTAKSEMVYGRLLSLGGKRELIVIRYACLWQNAPVQILVNLSVLTHITAPLRSNQKYVYSDLKLHVRKIKRNAQYSDLYTILYQRLINAFLKGALLPCKRASFTPQKSIFYHAKGHLLPCQSPPVISNLWIFITTLLMPFSFS